MKKILGLLFTVGLLFFSTVTDAKAFIQSEYELDAAATKVTELAENDLLSLVYKNELIGYRLESFNLQTMQYQRSAQFHADNLHSLRSKLDVIQNSIDFSDTEKDMQSRQLYQEADAALSDLNSKTISYLIGLRDLMPTVTYQRYVKRFLDYYNDLDLTDQDLTVRTY